MEIKNTTREALVKALASVNTKYANNIIFNRFDSLNGKDTGFAVTLRVKDSKELGHRCGFPKAGSISKGKRLINACWHVHGDFFDAVWEFSPDAVIKTGNLTMHGPEDNWQDRNIGSVMFPYYFSEACDC